MKRYLQAGKNLRFTLPLVLTALLLYSFNSRKPYRLIINPEVGVDCKNQILTLENPELLDFLNNSAYKEVSVRAKEEIPSQLIMEGDRITALLIRTDLKAGKTLKISISPADRPSDFKKGTYAELSVKEGGSWKDRKYTGGQFRNISSLHVPPQVSDHSFYIRYEGPGWESEKVGYRFYLDWRNAVDVYGKKVDTMVLASVGLDGYDSYHEMSDWGMDVLKVGETLGIGTPAWWSGKKAERIAATDSVYSEISYTGILESKILTKYYGWKTIKFKTDVNWQLGIRSGSRLTCSTLDFSEKVEGFCTGMVKMPGTETFTSTDGKWGYLATYGRQSLAGDQLGLVVFFPVSAFREFTDDGKSEIVILDPAGTNVQYWFGAAWEQEKDGITSKEEFLNYVRTEQKRLNEE